MIETRFKKTDIGEIPEDWEVKALGEIAPLQRGFDLPTSKVQNGIVPVVYSNGICNFHNKEICKAPGLVTGRSGTIGKFTFLPSGYYWPHNTTLWVTSFNNNNPLFIYYLYSSQRFEDFSGGSGVPTLNRNDVHEKKCSIPPLPEQQRIATALGDIDALLSSLNKKIAKKKLIKQGAMQKLLTGKKRLAGFTEPWVEKKLGEISSFIGGGTPNTNIEEYWNGTIPWISSSDISNGDIRNINITRYITEDAIKASATNKCPIGSILLITRVGIGKLAVANQTICTSQDFTNICIGTDYNSIFIAFLLSRLMIAKRDEGQGSTIKGITTEEIKSMIILLPLSLAEQTAIATILSDMDKEIEGLEAKRAKYEQVKQGMMQQLLTGKIRLID